MSSNLKQSKTWSDERPTGGSPRTGGRMACTAVHHNGEALSMTETWTKQILHYSHFQIKKKSQLLNLGVVKYTSLEEKVGKIDLK